jgi:hypothetical protein
MKIQHFTQKPIRLTTVMGVVEFGNQGIAEVPRPIGNFLCDSDFGQPKGMLFCTPLGDQGAGPADMTVPQLKAILAERKIEVPAGAKKAELVKLIEESNGAPTGGEASDAEKQGG